MKSNLHKSGVPFCIFTYMLINQKSSYKVHRIAFIFIHTLISLTAHLVLANKVDETSDTMLQGSSTYVRSYFRIFCFRCFIILAIASLITLQNNHALAVTLKVYLSSQHPHASRICLSNYRNLFS